MVDDTEEKKAKIKKIVWIVVIILIVIGLITTAIVLYFTGLSIPTFSSSQVTHIRCLKAIWKKFSSLSSYSLMKLRDGRQHSFVWLPSKFLHCQFLQDMCMLKIKNELTSSLKQSKKKGSLSQAWDSFLDGWDSPSALQPRSLGQLGVFLLRELSETNFSLKS